MDRVRVLIAEEQRFSRRFLELHIGAAPRYTLVCAVGSAAAAALYCQDHAVDLALLGMGPRGGRAGLEAATQIKRRDPGIRIIMTTSVPEASWLRRAREIGVESFSYRELDGIPLLEIMDRTMNGESIYPDAPPVVRLGNASSTDFTGQELAILRELTTGANNEEIAQRLYISVNTVRWHVQNLLSKTGYNSRIKLALHARASGVALGELIDIPD